MTVVPVSHERRLHLAHLPGFDLAIHTCPQSAHWQVHSQTVIRRAGEDEPAIIPPSRLRDSD